MSIVRIELLQGRAPKVKSKLIARVTGAVVTTLGVDPVQVRMLLYELPPEHWAVGGQTNVKQLSAFTQQQNEADE